MSSPYLTWGIASDKVLCNKTFHIANHLQYNGCQRRLTSMIHSFQKLKVYSSLIDNIWGPDLTNIQLYLINKQI